MLGRKQLDLLKYKKLGNKSMNDFGKLAGKFNMPSRHDLHILKEHDNGERPVRVTLHDSSDLGFDVNGRKPSDLEKGKHIMNLVKKV